MLRDATVKAAPFSFSDSGCVILKSKLVVLRWHGRVQTALLKP
jgi:hypothetical protein